MNKCENCGAPRRVGSKYCEYCGSAYPDAFENGGSTQRPSSYAPYHTYTTSSDGSGKRLTVSARRLLTAILSIALGAFGIEYFMLGNNKKGILCILLTMCSAGALCIIPVVFGWIEAIKLFIMTDADFSARYGASPIMRNL